MAVSQETVEPLTLLVSKIIIIALDSLKNTVLLLLQPKLYNIITKYLVYCHVWLLVYDRAPSSSH